jgi:hypothetical protein
VGTEGVRADVVQSHFFLGSPGLSLEEHRLSVIAFGAVMVFSTRESRVRNNVCDDVGQFIYFVHNFVDINTFGIGVLLVVAISARVHQDFVLFVFFGVQHVVAFLTESDPDESGALAVGIVPGRFRHFFVGL